MKNRSPKADPPATPSRLASPRAAGRARLDARLTVWSALTAPLAPALWGYTLYRRHVLKKSAASARGMWGHISLGSRRALHVDRARDEPVIWLHAVSVGEVMAARVVARALRQVLGESSIGGARLFLSVTTDGGMEAARAALQAGEVDALGFYPIDTPLAVRRALNSVRPALFLCLETELWPLFLGLCRARGVKTVLVNGRVSDRLQRDGQRLRPLFGWMLGNFSALLMRSPFDAERMRELAGPNAPIEVAGDVKLDAASPDHASAQERQRWRQVLGLEAGQALLCAGSTHAGEEEAIARVFGQLRAEMPHLRLLIAPRHTERAPQVLAALRQAGHAAILRSQLGAGGEEPDAIIVLDTVGELAGMYGACEAAFVGGSLIERGGHNILEPALSGAPAAFGPHVANFRVAAALAQEHGLGQMVQNEAELAQVLGGWLRERRDRGEAARADFAQRVEQALSPHRGASRRVAQSIVRILQDGA